MFVKCQNFSFNTVSLHQGKYQDKLNPLITEFFPQQYTFLQVQQFFPQEYINFWQVFLSHSICSSGTKLGGTSAHGETPLQFH